MFTSMSNQISLGEVRGKAIQPNIGVQIFYYLYNSPSNIATSSG